MMTASASSRCCHNCGALLASDNSEPACRPCQRAAWETSHSPPGVPASFWKAGEMREALEARHMGRVVHAYRNHSFHGRRRIPQEAMARWLCVSQAQLSRIEAGQPPRDLERLIQWATLLRIPRDFLWFDLGETTTERRTGKESWSGSAISVSVEPEAVTKPEPSPAVAELCAMITDYGFSPGRFGSAQRDEIPSPRDLERDVRIAFSSYQQSRFTVAASRVSMLLADAQLAARECNETERARISRVLALSYQAAASVLTKAGEPDLAWIAAERGFNTAEAAGATSVRGSLIRSVAFALLSTGRFEPAMRLVESGADYLSGEVRGNDTVLSVYGTLLLVGSLAAARFGDGSRTADYLRLASGAARRLGKDANHLWTAFGPTNVAIHRVNTAVELGNFQEVLNTGLSLNTDAVPEERRVRYLLDVARVYSLTGNRDDALGTMLTAERVAPEQVRQHYLSRRVVVALMQNAKGKPTAELDKLARRVKVGEPA